LFGGIASFVPYMGIALTIGPALGLTLLQHGVDWHLPAVVVAFWVAQAIEGSILTPKIIGEQVGLSPVWVILAIMVFGTTLGFLGLLLAVPIAAALKVLVDEAVAYYKGSPLFDGGGGSGGGAG
jgi:predicted PurR-regulated permease PerM